MAHIALLYGDDAKKGGIRAYSHMLGATLRNAGHKVSYINFNTLNSPIYKSPTSGWRELALTYLLGTYADYLSSRFDLIIGNGYYGAFCNHTAVTIYHFVYPSYTKHLGENPIKGIIGGLFEKKAGKNRLQIAVSQFLAEEIKRYYDYSPIVVPNGIDTWTFYEVENKEYLRKKWQLDPDNPVIAFVGRWNRRKGADVVEYVAANMPHVQFIAVVGYGNVTTDLPNISVFNSLSHQEINEIYNIADIVLYPSRYEPFGYVTAEGWAAGTPVITTNMGLGYELVSIPVFQPFIIKDMNMIKEQTLESVKWYLSLSDKERNDIRHEGSLYIRKHYNIKRWQSKMKEIVGYLLRKTS